MKQSKIINAYKTMEGLASINALSKEEQWNIYQLRKSLRTYVEFQGEREQILRDKFAKYADENGNLAGEKADEYIKELNELNNMEIEITIDKPKIRFVHGISFLIAEQLEDFIEFVQE